MNNTEFNYDKLQAFTECVTSLDQPSCYFNYFDDTIYNRYLSNTPPTPQYNERFYSSKSPIDYNNNKFYNTVNNNIYSNSTYPSIISNENNNLMLLSQFIEQEKMNFTMNKIEQDQNLLKGTGKYGQLTKEEEINFIIKHPNYLSSTLPGEKINRHILNQLFYKNRVGRFECKFCNQSFKRVNGLKRHIMMHLEIKPYKCDKCFRAFSRIDVFKRHSLRTKCMPTSKIES